MPPRAAARETDPFAALMTAITAMMRDPAITAIVARREPHLTTAELAERLGVRPRTVEDWRLDRKGPPYLPAAVPGGAVLYPLAWVEEWELSRRIVPAAS